MGTAPGDALLVASLVVAGKIDPEIAASLLATIAHDHGYPEALEAFAGCSGGGMAESSKPGRDAAIEQACVALLEACLPTAPHPG